MRAPRTPLWEKYLVCWSGHWIFVGETCQATGRWRMMVMLWHQARSIRGRKIGPHNNILPAANGKKMIGKHHWAFEKKCTTISGLDHIACYSPFGIGQGPSYAVLSTQTNCSCSLAKLWKLLQGCKLCPCQPLSPRLSNGYFGDLKILCLTGPSGAKRLSWSFTTRDNDVNHQRLTFKEMI